MSSASAAGDHSADRAAAGPSPARRRRLSAYRAFVAVAYFDVSDPAFSVRSERIHEARERDWYARTNYGLAVLRAAEVNELLKDRRLRQGERRLAPHNGVDTGPFVDSWVAARAAQSRGRRASPAAAIAQPDLAPARSTASSAVPDPRRRADRGVRRARQLQVLHEFAEPYAGGVIATSSAGPSGAWRSIPALVAEPRPPGSPWTCRRSSTGRGRARRPLRIRRRADRRSRAASCATTSSARLSRRITARTGSRPTSSARARAADAAGRTRPATSQAQARDVPAPTRTVGLLAARPELGDQAVEGGDAGQPDDHLGHQGGMRGLRVRRRRDRRRQRRFTCSPSRRGPTRDASATRRST